MHTHNCRDGHRFFRTNKNFEIEQNVCYKKTNDWTNEMDRSDKWTNYRFWKTKKKTSDIVRTVLIVHERFCSIFKWTNEFYKKYWKKSIIFYGTSGFFQTHFLKRTILLNERFFMNKHFYLKNNFSEQTILLNKWFYWTIIQWKNERN